MIKESVRKLYEAQQEKKKFEAFYNSVRKKEQISISNFMFTNLPEGQNSFEIELKDGVSYYENHVKLNVTRVRTKKIVWFLDKLKKKLDRPTYNSVVNKTYTVNDMHGLIEYLKSCGVDPKKFKKFIDVEEIVNEKEINRLYDTGKIKQSDVKGCYEVDMGDPYIRITELKG